ncbi:MAG TPA: SUMF1/EgtB/PvdO family nonheme iron enzyme, partial [Planctomycetota bacterium]|nr:SUMF1/EgtB/PvdO family nonheme iron enzyme [Planctomycetota bacterium]
PGEIRIAVIDEHGIEIVRVVSVTVDLTPPEISIASPPPGAWVRSPVLIEGRALGATVVAIDGKEEDVPPSGTFSIEVALPDGSRTLAVTARDASGLVARQDLSLRVDSSRPEIEIPMAADGRVVTKEARVSLRGRIDDGGELASVTAGGQPVAAVDGRFEIDVPLGSEGSRPFEIVARDAAGNEATRTIELVRDSTRPVVEITSPDLASPLPRGACLVSGTVRDGTQAKVRVNGIEARIESGDWRAEIELAPATRALVIEAVDAAGNLERIEKAIELAWYPRRVGPAEYAGLNDKGYPTFVDARAGIVFVGLPGGTVEIGADPELDKDALSEEKLHRVTLSPFLIGETELTWGKWKRLRPKLVLDDKQKKLLDEATERIAVDMAKDRRVDDDFPVEGVSWIEAKAFCDAAGYSLPTEAEWEYA